VIVGRVGNENGAECKAEKKREKADNKTRPLCSSLTLKKRARKAGATRGDRRRIMAIPETGDGVHVLKSDNKEVQNPEPWPVCRRYGGVACCSPNSDAGVPQK